MNRTARFAIVHRTLSSLIVCLCFACSQRREAGAPCPTIEMSAVADTPTDSIKAAVMPHDTTTILKSRPPLVTTGDITGATVSRAAGQWALDLTVTGDAAKRVHEFSERHVGLSLTLVVDGKVHGTPRISAAVVGTGYQIGGFDRADAERLATAMSGGCRR
jgi:preprotein translocase subunit SecD